MVKLPFIIILDLILIGYGNQLQLYKINKFIKDYCKHKKFTGDICKIPNKILIV